MKHVPKLTFAVLAAVLCGCGGTGGGSPKPTTSLNLNPRVECIVTVQRTNLMHPDEWTDAQLADPTNLQVKADLIDPTVFGVQDPTNIEEGEEMTFQLVNYTAAGQRQILQNVSFQSSDSGSTFGVLASNTGQYVAGASATTQPLFVSATFNGQTFATQYDIKIRQVRVLGTVLDGSNNAADLAGAQVEFFDQSGTLVDTVTVQFDGSFRASVPTITTQFTIFGDSLPDTFYHSFSYGGLQYDANPVGCIPAMPTGLVVGTTILPSTLLVTPRVSGQSTPPSTGCNSGPVVHKKG